MRIISKDLTYIYSQKSPFAKKAVNNVSITIEEGDFFGIIGHTGSGKSTFVQHINGLIPVSAGALKAGDFNLKKYSRKEYKKVAFSAEDQICFKEGKKLSYGKYKKAYAKGIKALRASVGMVFQYPEYQLFGDTVFDDVAFGLRNFYPDYTDIQTKVAVQRAIERVGLNFEEVKDKSPFDLSGGQKRRVAIAGVIVTEPEVLILDEPVAGLDPQGKKELMALLHELHGTAIKTVVIVSHDMDDVSENCNMVAVFSKGEVVATLPPKELFKKGELLRSVGLDVPLTAYLTEGLKQTNTYIDSDFTIDGFVSAVAQAYRGKQ